jgi:hypothetical protein
MAIRPPFVIANNATDKPSKMMSVLALATLIAAVEMDVRPNVKAQYDAENGCLRIHGKRRSMIASCSIA